MVIPVLVTVHIGNFHEGKSLGFVEAEQAQVGISLPKNRQQAGAQSSSTVARLTQAINQ
jgi:hypothetical protein